MLLNKSQTPTITQTKIIKFDAVFRQVFLEPFGAIGLSGTLVDGADFHFQPRFLPRFARS